MHILSNGRPLIVILYARYFLESWGSLAFPGTGPVVVPIEPFHRDSPFLAVSVLEHSITFAGLPYLAFPLCFANADDPYGIGIHEDCMTGPNSFHVAFIVERQPRCGEVVRVHQFLLNKRRPLLLLSIRVA